MPMVYLFRDAAFDIDRMLCFDPTDYTPLRAPRFLALAPLVSAGKLDPATPVLAMEFPDSAAPLVFSTQQMVYHHVAQGKTGACDWMMTYCVICNAGSCFSPIVDDRPLSFFAVGIYDAMTVLADVETHSYWHHITGECVYGALRGKRLQRLNLSPLHMTAQQAAERYPSALFAAPSLTPAQAQVAREDNDEFQNAADSEYFADLLARLNLPDTRLPPLDMGLGVWTPGRARYYPYTRLNAADNIVLDMLEGRPLMVYVDPDTSTPCAFYTNAERARWRGDTLVLSTGETVSGGVLRSPRGERLSMPTPEQLFHRWYSFALVFPNGEIYA
jgi:hypothetical protein